MGNEGGLDLMKKSEMRQKRIEILKKIDALQSKCNCFSAEDFHNCSNCKRIAKYGEKLLKLVSKRKESLPIKRTKVNLTKSEYLALKREEKTDKEIALMCNVCTDTIRNWKQANKIITKPISKKKSKAN